MLAHIIPAIGFTAWAALLWALLPKAFSLQLRRHRREPLAFKLPPRGFWKPSAAALVTVLSLALLKLSVS